MPTDAWVFAQHWNENMRNTIAGKSYFVTEQYTEIGEAIT